MPNDITEELNNFLKGNLMAIHAYDHYIHRIKDQELKQTFQQIQQNHKHHASLIAERIQNLGGIPADDVGMMGNAAELMNNIKVKSKDSDSILKDALLGEQRGIEKSKQILNDDLDHESLELVKNILAIDEQHVDLLDEFIH